MIKEEVKKEEVKKPAEEKPLPTAMVKNVNYIHYDPGKVKKVSKNKSRSNPKKRISTELHWCDVCGVFPKTAKDFLNHLHTEMHQNNVKNPEFPWREKMQGEEPVVHPNAPTKRTPIRGLQFFIPSTSWYCKICSFWMGDLHSASNHLKSMTHSEKYSEYVSKNPNFEIDWMSERQKAYEKAQEKSQEEKVVPAPVPAPQIELNLPTQGQSKPTFENIPLQIQENWDDKKDDKKNKKKKTKKEEKKDKKKKKRSKKKKHTSSSSSSSSSSDSSDSDSSPERKSKDDNPSPLDSAISIRAAMRNILKAQQESTKTKDKNLDNNLGEIL